MLHGLKARFCDIFKHDDHSAFVDPAVDTSTVCSNLSINLSEILINLQFCTMGARISHMNLYALSTLVQADDYDVENILFLFEGKPKKFRHVAHETTGKVYEDVPMRANPTDEELLEKYYVEGDLKETWDRQEALKAAKLAAIEAAEQERKDREREAMQEARRRQQASSKKREAKAQVKQVG